MELQKALTIGAVLLALFICGCASVYNSQMTFMSDKTDYVEVKSIPPEADCRVGDIAFKTPAVVEMRRKYTHLVSCQFADGANVHTLVNWRLSEWVWGNALLGMVPALIDLANPAAYVPDRDPVVVKRTAGPLP